MSGFSGLRGLRRRTYECHATFHQRLANAFRETLDDELAREVAAHLALLEDDIAAAA